MVWKKISDSQKMDFLYKNFTPEITPRTQEILVGKSWNFLPKNVKIKFESKYANVEDYATGGSLKKKDSSVKSTLADAKKRVARMTDVEVVEEFSTIFYYEMQDNDTDEADLYNDMPQTRKMLVEHYEDQYNHNGIKPFEKGGNLGASENAPYKHDLKVGLYESKNPQNPYEEGYYLSVSDPIKDSTMLKLKKGGMTKKEFQAKKMGKVMHEFKQGDLHSGKSGKIVKNREQAIVIGLSEVKRGWKNRNK
jgi:hypothetical protein